MAAKLSAVILSVLAFITIALCIPPLVAHITARNLAASILVAGILIANVQNFVNALIWPSNPLETRWDGQGLCDVEVKLYIGIGMAISGAIASIYRQLAIVLNTDKTTITPSQKQRYTTRAFETAVCLIFPAYAMGIHYVVQPNRYYLLAVTGCVPTFATTWLSYILINMWPLLVCLLGVMYCIIAVIRLVKYRRSVSSILSNSSTITKACYVRLFVLASCLMLVYLPLSAYTLFQTAIWTSRPYSWTSVHPPQWSKLILRLDEAKEKEYHYFPFDRWFHIAAGFLSFVLFGLGHEAVTMYKAWFARTGMSIWWPSSMAEQKPMSSSLSGLAELATSHTSQAPIRDAYDLELEQIDKDCEPGTGQRSI